METTPKIYGFSLLRNGIKYDYPYRESLKSLCDLSESVYVTVGKSEDGTEATLAEFKNLKIIPTIWDENQRKSGLILSEQTNIALDDLRKNATPNSWGMYLQADEVLNPDDFEQIKIDIARAHEQGCDAVSFRYLHFWQNYHSIAISKRWYPQEIRAVSLSSKATSYGDAQSFKNCENIFNSDVPVFHYGHVREAAAYERKKKDFGRWWHKDNELEKILARGAKKEKHERVLSYYGPHPSYMREKIGTDSSSARELLVYGQKENYSAAFISSIQAKLQWTMNWRDLISRPSKSVVVLEKLPWFFPILTIRKYRSKVPNRMISPQARPWTKEFWAILKFSEKGIPVK